MFYLCQFILMRKGEEKKSRCQADLKVIARKCYHLKRNVNKRGNMFVLLQRLCGVYVVCRLWSMHCLHTDGRTDGLERSGCRLMEWCELELFIIFTRI